jgi:hypothetical protein
VSFYKVRKEDNRGAEIVGSGIRQDGDSELA